MTEKVPFLRPELGEAEEHEVVATLRSGWLTSGPRVHRFEREFAASVRSTQALAVNSCTAALHLAVEALRLKSGQGVLVPTMTFAATAEVVRYQGATPILVDCDPVTGNMDLHDATRKINQLRAGCLSSAIPSDLPLVGMIPVHVGGLMMNVRAVKEFAAHHGLWLVEDAAHSFPAAWRPGPDDSWQRCGEGTADVSCFSFYANKTITTGEGGMAVTNNAELAERMKLMCLHGLSHDAWGRYTGNGSWDYKIVAPGYKYNLTDIAAAIGIHQLARAEAMRVKREAVALRYIEALGELEEIELPHIDLNRIHSWHLFPIRLKLNQLTIDRNAFKENLQQSGIGSSVHWRPLHLHPYYQDTFGWRAEEFPIATALWQRLISLPIFSAMRDDEVEKVIRSIKEICLRCRRRSERSVIAGEIDDASLRSSYAY